MKCSEHFGDSQPQSVMQLKTPFPLIKTFISPRKSKKIVSAVTRNLESYIIDQKFKMIVYRRLCLCLEFLHISIFFAYVCKNSRHSNNLRFTSTDLTEKYPSKKIKHSYYRGPNIAEKNLRNFTILAKILSVPISPNVPISTNFFKIYISNYFVCVMNDVNSRIEFPKSTLINFYLIAFGVVLNSTHFGYSRHSNLS
jgi:hypothetical protein